MTTPRPLTGEDSERVIDNAVGSLGTLRELPWLGDAGTTIHLLTSLIRQAEEALPAAVAEARDQEYSWAEIARMLGTTPSAARRLHAVKPANTCTARRGTLPRGEIRTASVIGLR